MIPLAGAFISCRWWENYVSYKSSYSLVRYLSGLRERLSESRYHIYVYLAPWKVFIFLLIGMLSSGIEVVHFFTQFTDGWKVHTIQIVQVKTNFGFF